MAKPEEEIEDSAAPLIEHLAELRTRLIRSVIALVIGISVFFIPIQGDFLAEHVLQFMLQPIEQTLRALGDPSPTLQFTSPQEYLFTLFRISLVFGFALAFPVIGFQLWRFVAPGLYKSEKNAFLPFLVASPCMFLLGASFAHFVVTPLAMSFFLGFADVSSIFANLLAGATDLPEPTVVLPDTGAINLPDLAVPETEEGLQITFFGKVNESLSISLTFIIAFGLCFQLPVLLTLMGKAGLVSARGLANVRKYAVVGILVLAALVTPPDVVTQLILFCAVYGLYEISIQLVRMVEAKRVKQLREEGILGEDEDLYSEFEDDELEDAEGEPDPGDAKT